MNEESTRETFNVYSQQNQMKSVWCNELQGNTLQTKCNAINELNLIQQEIVQ